MMGLVSCQVSSLLALSVTQRSDKKEPGVGLSLPLAKEVSFSPSIIHILFNLTRYKWPRNAALADTVSHLCQTNMDRLVFFFFFTFLFNLHSLRRHCNYAVNVTEKFKTQNKMWRFWKAYWRDQLSQAAIHKKDFHCCFCSYKQFPCLKRENANDCAINDMNMIKNILLSLCFLCIYIFSNLLREINLKGEPPCLHQMKKIKL